VGIEPRRPTQRRGEGTVEAIRAAAARLLRTRDFARVSIADIARAAGVGVGTLYHYYPSKEALLLDLRADLFRRSTESLIRGFRTPIRDGRTFVRRFEALLRSWIRMSVESRGLERAVAALSFAREAFSEEVRRQELPVLAAVAGLIRAHAPLLRPVDPEVAARVVVLLVEAVVTRAMREPDLSRKPEAVVREVARMVARYLIPPGERR
jgi:AcrR family transcriptional regulator